MIVKSRYTELTHLDNELFIDDVIRYEPNLYLCDVEHVKKLGGPAIRYIIEQLGLLVNVNEYYFTVRVAYLEEGQRMHHLDWHCDGNDDGLLLSERADLQHIIGHVGSANAPIEYINQDVEIDDIVYRNSSSYDELCDKLSESKLETQLSLPGTFTKVVSTDIHRACANTKTGWRMWVLCNNVVHPFLKDYINTVSTKPVKLF